MLNCTGCFISCRSSFYRSLCLTAFIRFIGLVGCLYLLSDVGDDTLIRGDNIFETDCGKERRGGCGRRPFHIDGKLDLLSVHAYSSCFRILGDTGRILLEFRGELGVELQ